MNIAKYILPFLISNCAFAQSYFPVDHTVTCGHTIKYKNKTVTTNILKRQDVQKFRFQNEGDEMYIILTLDDKTTRKYLLGDNDVCSTGNTK